MPGAVSRVISAGWLNGCKMMAGAAGFVVK